MDRSLGRNPEETMVHNKNNVRCMQAKNVRMATDITKRKCDSSSMSRGTYKALSEAEGNIWRGIKN
jgi:hypothetical protein